MGSNPRPGAKRPRSARRWEPSGAGWEAFRKHLWARWRAAHRSCWHCGCPAGTAPPDQIEHRISPQKRPDLAMTEWWAGEPFLVPTHGKCPPPPAGCGLSCNNLSAGLPAPRDSLGRSLPFDEKYKARKMAEAAARAAGGAPARGAAKRQGPPPQAPARQAIADAGREWLCHFKPFYVRGTKRFPAYLPGTAPFFSYLPGTAPSHSRTGKELSCVRKILSYAP